LKKQFRQAAVAAANVAAAAAVEPVLTDANDDEISQITLGNGKQTDSVPDTQTKKVDEKVDFGLPDYGAFSDAHDGERQRGFGDRKASISTQKDFAVAGILQESLSAGKTSSFEPTSGQDVEVSSASLDQPTTKSVGKEQL
jgi:hypothetical protein